MMESLERAKKPLKRALEIDDELADTHDGLAQLRFNSDYLSAAEAEASKPKELNPTPADAYWVLQHVEAVKGGMNGALRFAETTYQLDPIKA